VWHAPGRALPHSFSHVVLACGAAFIAKALHRQFARVSRAAGLIEKNAAMSQFAGIRRMYRCSLQSTR
jgi:hypothetical protein